MTKDDLEKIKLFCKQCGVSNVEKFMDDCLALKDILLSENKKYNLTRIQEDHDYWNKHIADSLSVVLSFPELREKDLTLADVGCGAGFPSLVLAIAFKNLKITAIDSIKKKTNFVDFAAKELGLDNLNVIWGRTNELKISGIYDYITARAVAEPIKVFKESRKLLKKNGKIIIYQTPRTKTDSVSTLNKLTQKFSYKWGKSDELTLPGGEKRIFIYSTPTKISP